MRKNLDLWFVLFSCFAISLLLFAAMAQAEEVYVPHVSMENGMVVYHDIIPGGHLDKEIQQKFGENQKVIYSDGVETTVTFKEDA